MVDRVIHGELHESQRRHSHNASVVDDARKLFACGSVQSFEFDGEGTIIEMQEARQVSRGLQADVAEARGGAEVIDLLSQVSPEYFETVVLDVLHKMGYGTSRADLLRVGRSGRRH